MYFLVAAAWLVVTVVSYNEGNRKLPMGMGVLGLLAQAGFWMLGLGFWVFGIGFWGIAALALLTIIGMFSAPEIFLRK